MIVDLDGCIKFLENVKDDNRIDKRDKFVVLDPNIIYNYLIELRDLRKKNANLRNANHELRKRLKNKVIKEAELNPFDPFGIQVR